MFNEKCITEYLREVFKAVLKEELPNHLQRDKKVENTDDLLTIDKLSEYLKISKATIYGKTSRNELPFIKKGKKLLFKKSEIDKWLETGRVLTDSELEALAERVQMKKERL